MGPDNLETKRPTVEEQEKLFKAQEDFEKREAALEVKKKLAKLLGKERSNDLEL